MKSLVSFFVVVVALFGQVQAVTNWESPVAIGVNTAVQPACAMDASGNAFAVWSTSNVIQAANRSVNGSWSSPVTISQAGEKAVNPQVIVDETGNAVALWQVTAKNANTVIKSAKLSVNETKWVAFSDPLSLSNASIYTGLCLNVDRQGNVMATWGSWDDAESTAYIESARLSAGATSWTCLTPILQGDVDCVNFDFDQNGNAMCVWQDMKTNSIVMATLEAGGANWSQPASVLPSIAPAIIPQVKLDKSGNALVTFLTPVNRMGIGVAMLPFGSTSWQLTQFPTTNSTSCELLIDNVGDAYLFWRLESFSAKSTAAPLVVAKLAISTGSTKWSKPTLISPDKETIQDFDVACDQAGNFVAIWVNSTQNTLQVATQPAGKSWTSPINLATVNITQNFYDNGFPQLALSGQGSATILYPSLVKGAPKIVSAVSGQNLFAASKTRVKKLSRTPIGL